MISSIAGQALPDNARIGGFVNIKPLRQGIAGAVVYKLHFCENSIADRGNGLRCPRASAVLCQPNGSICKTGPSPGRADKKGTLKGSDSRVQFLPTEAIAGFEYET